MPEGTLSCRRPPGECNTATQQAEHEVRSGRPQARGSDAHIKMVAPSGTAKSTLQTPNHDWPSRKHSKITRPDSKSQGGAAQGISHANRMAQWAGRPPISAAKGKGMQGATFLRHFLLHTPAGSQRKNPNTAGRNTSREQVSDGILLQQLTGQQRPRPPSPHANATRCVCSNSKNTWNSAGNSRKGKKGNWKKNGTVPTRSHEQEGSDRAHVQTPREAPEPEEEVVHEVEVEAELLAERTGHAPRPTLARATVDRQAKTNGSVPLESREHTERRNKPEGGKLEKQEGRG